VKDEIPDRVGNLLFLAQGYQATGNHLAALATLDRCQQVVPFLGKQKEYKRIRAVSEKNRGTHKAIRVPEVESRGAGVSAQRDWSGGLARAAWPTVLLGALLAYLALAVYQGLNRPVRLVNGLDVSYTVAVGDQVHTLRPGLPVEVRVGEGPLSVAVQDEALGIPPVTVEVRTPFWSRPFARPLLVVNPDGAAVLLRETVYYSEGSAEGGPQGSASLHVGLPLYAFPRPDFAFEGFPQTVSVPKSGKPVPRTRVALFPPEMPPEQVLQAVARHVGVEAAAVVAGRRLPGAPNSLDYLHFLASTVQPQGLVGILRPGLPARPVRIEWHRVYQNARQDSGGAQDVIDEYREMLAREPDQPALQYLLGRVVDTADEAVRLFEQATTGSSPCEYGYSALAHKYLAQGQFDRAAEYAAKAVAAQPDHPGFRLAYTTALMAAGRHEAALAELRRQAATAPGDTGLLLDMIQVHAAQGGPAAAEQCLKEWTETLRSQGAPAADLARIGESMQTHVAYVTGDLDRFAVGATQSGDALLAFAEALSAGRTEDADAALAKVQPPNSVYHLLMFAAGRQAGLGDLAERHLQAAIQTLRQGHLDQRAVHSKAVYLTVLGLLYPDQQAACFGLARVLNFRRVFPHRLLAGIVGPPEPP
jgi:tetratricopeptide (TPR) repeat protein